MRKDTVMVWGSFIGFFTWYHIIFYNFTNSPLRVLTGTTVAADPQAMLILFHIATGAAMIFAFFFLKDNDLQSNRPLWVLMHIAMLGCVVFIPFAGTSPLYLLVTLCGGLYGVLSYRVLYSSFFYAPKIGWARMVVVTFICLNIFIHLYALVPKNLNPVLMYAISIAVLGAALAMSLAYRGNTLEVRKFLPENKLAWKDILPVVLLLVGTSICFSAYRSIVLTIMPETFEIAVWQAIVCAISLAVLFLLGDRLKQGAYLKLFLALLTAAFISFQLLGTAGHKVVETFMQPAYFCWDILLFYYLRGLFYRYGKHYRRLRTVLVIFFLSIVISEYVGRWFFSEFFADGLQYFGLLYIVIFGLVMLVPQISRALTPPDGGEPEKEAGVELPPPRAVSPRSTEDVLSALLLRLSPAEYLTARETDVLKLLLEWQDVDVIAYMLSISQNTVRTHIKHICEKFGVSSKSELVHMAGIVGAANRFSRREAEVLRLAAAGKSDMEIAEELFISTNTVRSHIHNLCKKCNVSNRRELIRYYNETCQA